jgi:hypothetical protein
LAWSLRSKLHTVAVEFRFAKLQRNPVERIAIMPRKRDTALPGTLGHWHPTLAKKVTPPFPAGQYPFCGMLRSE